MTEMEFEEFLHRQIPITKAMELSVLEFSSSRVLMQAKLEPNINHKSTAFGGSISSLVTICGWALVFANIKTIDESSHIVIQKSSINYIKPITGDFTAECVFTDETARQLFLDTFEKHGKTRLKLNVQCWDNDKLAAEFEGQYVAFK